jgi:hypothetical protein
VSNNNERKVVIITGASSGLGETTARPLGDLRAVTTALVAQLAYEQVRGPVAQTAVVAVCGSFLWRACCRRSVNFAFADPSALSRQRRRDTTLEYDTVRQEPRTSGSEVRATCFQEDDTMSTGSTDELRKIAETDDLHVSPFRDDGDRNR